MGWILVLFMTFPGHPVEPVPVGVMFNFAGIEECMETAGIMIGVMRELDERFKGITYECQLKT